jgi:hypothetical protein
MKAALSFALAAASAGFAQSSHESTELISGTAYLNMGYQASYYPDRTNAFLEDHGGPSFELELGMSDVKLTGYFSPWTTQPRAMAKVWNDTLYDYDRFNPIKAGLLLGSRFLVTRRTEWGFNTGFEWVTFDGFKEKESREEKSIRMPTVLGAVFGLDYHRDVLLFGDARVGYKLSYRYSTADYRVFNKALDYGTHEWSLLFSLGGKTFKPPRRWNGGDSEPDEKRPREFF